jgi:D-3-phosphoglycerate dehydrogenase
MARANILNVEPDRCCEAARTILRACGDLREEAVATRAGLLRAVRDADVLLTRLAHRIDGEVLAAAPHLRAVVTPTTGLTHIDLEAAAQRGVTILSLRGETAFLDRVTATAELAWGLLISLSRRLPEAFAHTQGGGWNRDLLRGHELQGRTLGLIGFGRLGRMMARFGLAFRMRVLACDPAPGVVVPADVERAPLERLLAESDAISVHASLTEASRGIIDASAFARMKPGVLFINTARGELVDEAALLAALHSGRVGAAAVDVLAGEPFAGPEIPPAHPLAAFARAHPDRLLLTPHIGGATFESMAATEVFMAERLRSWLDLAPSSAGKGNP